MACNQFNFETIKGDTWDGAMFQIIVNSGSLDLSYCNIKADFKVNRSDTAAYTMSTENNRIEITEPLEGKFRMIPQIINLKPATYIYDMQFTFTDTLIVKTYFSGHLTVSQDITT